MRSSLLTYRIRLAAPFVLAMIPLLSASVAAQETDPESADLQDWYRFLLWRFSG